MNKLIASWHRAGSDVVDHLMHAHGQLLDHPDRAGVLALVDAALLELSLAETEASPERASDNLGVAT
jgi:hypothetical protein